MRRRTLYLTCLAAYLTGWPIVQAIYNRVVKHVLDRDGEEYAEEIAFKAIEKYEEVTRRRTPLSGLEVIADADYVIIDGYVVKDRDDAIRHTGTYQVLHNHPHGTICGETCPMREERTATERRR